MAARACEAWGFAPRTSGVRQSVMRVSLSVAARRAAVGAALALFVAGCERGEVDPEPAPPPPKAAPVVGPVLLTFGEAGAGELSSATTLDRRRIESLFPGARVQVRTVDGDAPVEMITVRRDDGLALDLLPGATAGLLGRIIGRGGPVVGALGEPLGAGWTTAGFAPEDCQPGQEDMAGRVVCHRPGAPQLGYVFETAGFQGPDDVMPSPETLEASARLSAFVWTAPAA